MTITENDLRGTAVIAFVYGMFAWWVIGAVYSRYKREQERKLRDTIKDVLVELNEENQ